MIFSEDLMQELVALAAKHHAQDIPVMNETELNGVLIYLRRIDNECNSEGC